MEEESTRGGLQAVTDWRSNGEFRWISRRFLSLSFLLSLCRLHVPAIVTYVKDDRTNNGECAVAYRDVFYYLIIFLNVLDRHPRS